MLCCGSYTSTCGCAENNRYLTFTTKHVSCFCSLIDNIIHHINNKVHKGNINDWTHTCHCCTMAAPEIAFSDIGVSRTLSLPNSSSIPTEVPKSPPKIPTSSPIRKTFSSRRISSDIAMIIRSEEHTSGLQSRPHLVCRLLLEKKKRQLHIG